MPILNLDILKNSMVVGEDSLKITNNIKVDVKDNVLTTSNIQELNNVNIENKLIEDHSISTWKPSTTGNKRILFCGTYPIGQSNGYSRVVYYISKFLGEKNDVDLTIYGFQNFGATIGASIRNDIPSRVKLHDAFATEEPKRNGFGEKEIGKFLKQNPQDVIIIFNDPMITTALTQTIINECGVDRHHFRLVSYMDQVYPYQKKSYIEVLNRYFDSIIAFTPYWEGIARKLGIRENMPMYYFPHGFDYKLYYPIPMNIARVYFKYPDDAFMVLNLNRNQPRKRWDTTIIAWAEFVERHYNVNVSKKIKKSDEIKINKHTARPIKLVVGTMMDGYWNLMDVFENEIKFRDVPWDYAKETIIAVPAPQQLSDRDINILHNACNVGLNSADGEGFGLCGFESMGLGKPQVSANVGGIKEFMDNTMACVIEPSFKIYLDNKSNGIGGAAELTDPHLYAEAFWKYLSNPDLADKHGKRARKHILTNYRWETMVDFFHRNIVPKL
jgi:glycosyltransferase involved in cell wall biosynthesis